MMTSWKWAMTNGFSKKVENHVFALALHMMGHNFAHSMLRMSPAMAASVWDRLLGDRRRRCARRGGGEDRDKAGPRQEGAD
jgi:hypothetical protein